MTKMRVHELAKELGMENKELIDLLHKKNVEVSNHMSSIEDNIADEIRKEKNTRSEGKSEGEEAPKKKNLAFVIRPQNSKNSSRIQGKRPAQKSARPQQSARQNEAKAATTRPASQGARSEKSGAEKSQAARPVPAQTVKAETAAEHSTTEKRPGTQAQSAAEKPQGVRQEKQQPARAEKPVQVQSEKEKRTENDRPARENREARQSNDRPVRENRDGKPVRDGKPSDRQGRFDRGSNDRSRQERPQGNRQFGDGRQSRGGDRDRRPGGQNGRSDREKRESRRDDVAAPIVEQQKSQRNKAKDKERDNKKKEYRDEAFDGKGKKGKKPKRGFFVCQVEELAELHIPVKIEEEEEEIRPEKIPYDFSSAGVDMEQFPYHIWRKLLKEIMINDNSELFQKGNFQGDLELRKAIMYYLRQSRGVHVHASQIVVAAGMENLLFLLRQILGEKVSIGIENPVYKNAYEILKELDFKIHPISMDESGMCVEQLQKTDANLAYVTPAHQYPTGVIMPIGRRSQLLGWAKKDPDHYIIEDDYDSEFRYHGKPIPAMQGLDDGENVIYMGTFSKAIAPAIRASYMVLPKKLAKRYQQIGQTFSCAVSRIDQKVLTLFLTEGHFERHLNRMRNIYKEKHDLLIKEIKKLNSDIQIYGHGAGAHIIVRFPVSDQKEFQKKLRQKGVMIYPLSWYYIEGKPLKEEYILGFTRMKKEDMIRGIEIIGEVLYSK